eukprot:Rhum_TRINITY_DN14535_c24_g1::Rhum_TRINITY_DN14535_c24_g1_i1::g.98400::m.98400
MEPVHLAALERPPRLVVALLRSHGHNVALPSEPQPPVKLLLPARRPFPHVPRTAEHLEAHRALPALHTRLLRPPEHRHHGAELLALRRRAEDDRTLPLEGQARHAAARRGRQQRGAAQHDGAEPALVDGLLHGEGLRGERVGLADAPHLVGALAGDVGDVQKLARHVDGEAHFRVGLEGADELHVRGKLGQVQQLRLVLPLAYQLQVRQEALAVRVRLAARLGLVQDVHDAQEEGLLPAARRHAAVVPLEHAPLVAARLQALLLALLVSLRHEAFADVRVRHHGQHVLLADLPQHARPAAARPVQRRRAVDGPVARLELVCFDEHLTQAVHAAARRREAAAQRLLRLLL